MDNALHTAYICDDGVRTDILLEIFQIFHIKFNRCAQENIITFLKPFILFFTHCVDHIAADCCGKCFPVPVIGKDMVIFVVFPDGPGN